MPDVKTGVVRRRWLSIAAVSLVVMVVGVAIGWATAVVFTPRTDVIAESPFTHIELVEGEIGSSASLNTVAEWEQSPVGTNQAAGTVTGVRIASGDLVSPGTVLYEVELRPVVVAAGTTPAFRALARGSTGSDVAQLQGFLAGLGFYDGAVDGEFGLLTERAVGVWQESLGLDDDGVVQAGDLVFVPDLPTRITLDDKIVSRGAILSGGELVVSSLSAEPSFAIPATSTQAADMPIGTSVEISYSGHLWRATVNGHTLADDNSDQVSVELEGMNGGAVCGAECSVLPVASQSLLPSRVITQETVRGVVAPTAALRSSAEGSVSVIDSEGEVHLVKVIASARGMSVIEGAPTGLKVQVPVTTEKASE